MRKQEVGFSPSCAVGHRYYKLIVPDIPLSSKADRIDALLEEVHRNGCAEQLTTPSGEALQEIARSYRNHPYHASMDMPLNDGELLSLVLYTGCDCNYAMTHCLLNGDLETWKVFDFTLSMAIGILSCHTRCQDVPLYTHGITRCSCTKTAE